MALVLGALSRTEGRTAGEVAAATGLKRETVSTTLNKLAKTGEAKKASRGYLMASLSASSDAPTAPGSLEP
jgi:DNA-binding IclR family transcriptional regulator